MQTFCMTQRLLTATRIYSSAVLTHTRTIYSMNKTEQSSVYPSHVIRSNAFTSSSSSNTSVVQKQSSTQRIKVVLKEYGSVAVVFHTVMSLTSLGTCYLIVDSGVDVGKVLEYFNVQSSSTSKGASTFAVAYVLHKMILPLRAGITVASVPLIVRWFRSKGWMKGSVATKVPTK